MPDRFDTTPKPAFLRAVQNQKWSEAGALAELVDNSFGPGRGNARRVEIIYDAAKRTISIIDDGKGMECLGRLFQLGNTIGMSPGDIGQYGSGGTMAILWLARKVAVWTLRNKRVSYDSVDWSKQIASDKYPTISNAWEPCTIGNVPVELLNFGHGTLIKLDLAHERKVVPSAVRRELSQIYAPAVRSGRELVWKTVSKGTIVDEIPLSDPLPLPCDPDHIRRFDLVVEVGGDHLGVRGVVGLIKDLPFSRSHVAIGYGTRVITRTRECYKSVDGSEKYEGSGVSGWLDLKDGWQPYLSTTKDAINDQRAWDALMQYVFEEIKPLLKQVDDEAMTLEFHGLAINLQNVLNASLDQKVTVSYSADLVPDDLPGTENKGVGRRKPPLREVSADGKHSKAIPRVSVIRIASRDDTNMQGALCRATVWQDRSSDSIAIDVNRDHDIVREAMKSKPVNRMAFNILVVQEMSYQLSLHPTIISRIFPKHLSDQLLGNEDKSDVGRQITRLLIDRVRSPIKMAA